MLGKFNILISLNKNWLKGSRWLALLLAGELIVSPLLNLLPPASASSNADDRPRRVEYDFRDMPDYGRITLGTSLDHFSDSIAASGLRGVEPTGEVNGLGQPIVDTVEVENSEELVRYLMLVGKFVVEEMLSDFYGHLLTGLMVFGKNAERYRHNLGRFTNNMRKAYDGFPHMTERIDRLVQPVSAIDSSLQITDRNTGTAVKVAAMERALLMLEFDWKLGKEASSNSDTLIDDPEKWRVDS